MNEFALECPLPLRRHESVLAGHGSGGQLSRDLIHDLIVPAFSNNTLARLEDQATLDLPRGRIAFSTDSYVVRPIFFPGGDIGMLAIHGTLNDLAMGGATPQFLSAALILEEGFAISELERVLESMRKACQEAKVSLVTGDTKVVEKGKGDKIFITTTGLGVVPDSVNLSCRNAKPGDAVIVSGTLGDHGMAVLAVREGLEFESDLISDTANLYELSQIVLTACPETRCMRDPTRGGLASALNEIAEASSVKIQIDEGSLPIRPEVKAGCELLGLDPLYIANEGKLVAIVPEYCANHVVSALRSHCLGVHAAIIGRVMEKTQSFLTLKTVIGGERSIPLLVGEQLPRIC